MFGAPNKVSERRACRVRDLDIVPLAEVIECEGEATVCRELQFELAQGFYFGKPAPVTWFSSEPEPIQA